MEEYSEQSRHLLPDHERQILARSEDRPESAIFTWKKAVLLIIVLLLGYIAFQVSFYTYSEYTCGHSARVEGSYVGIVPKHALQLEERPEWYPLRTPWNQKPSDELDAIWKDLLHALNIRITNDEMSFLKENKSNRVQVTGGNQKNGYDYVGVLGVYHHLHCLNNLRRVIHWDYYGPKMSGLKHPEGFSKEHSDHCIDAIRQALMCHANTDVYTSEWNYESHNPSTNIQSRSSTTCVRWDSLNNWARDKALVPGEYHYIRGPYDPDRVGV
ncbi:hypothetical protein F5Y09DRAFT_343505 [Xylaria sp. FL1042]|nr:hypothetical protein F5Y09DRAFT_343505 [Xylaria sp. FL1042]